MHNSKKSSHAQSDDTKDRVLRYFTARRLAEYLAGQTRGEATPKGRDKFRIEGAGLGGLEIETKDGRAVWHNHAEGIGGDCFEAFKHFQGITDFRAQLDRGAELAGIGSNGNTAPKKKTGASEKIDTRRTPDAEYQYTDADGRLIRMKRRWNGPDNADGEHEKTFLFFHPNADGRMIAGAGDGSPLLYRLPDVLSASGTVWICEGEKDADAMAGHGQTATSPEHGAGAGKWRQEYTDALRGLHVRIIADADEIGRAHAKGIAEKLFFDAASVKIIECPKGKDPAAFFELGGDVAELVHIADKARAFVPGYADDPKRADDPTPGASVNETVSTWADAAERIGKITWSWEGWLPNALLTMLVSESGKGKSGLALRIASCFIRGDKWPDGTPFTGELGAVLWCESEGALSVNVDRARKAGLPFDKLISPLSDTLEEFTIDNAEHMEALRQRAARTDVRLIVLDSLSGATRQDENSSSMLHSVKSLAQVAAESGKPFLLLHHLNKGISEGDGIHQRQVRGSSAIIQTARVVWGIDAPNEEDAEHRRLSVVKNNLAKFALPLGFRISESGITFTADAPRRARPETQEDKARAWIIAQLEGGARPSAEILEAAEAAGIPTRTLARAKEAAGVTSVKTRDGWKMSLPSRHTVPETGGI